MVPAGWVVGGDRADVLELRRKHQSGGAKDHRRLIAQPQQSMRILLLHNFYGSSAPSGENQAFHNECQLLRDAGHDVEVISRSSDDIRSRPLLGLLQGAVATPWNPMAYRAVSRAIDTFRPDVVHAHNTFPLLSPAVLWAAHRRAATLLTLHNYRLVCPAAIPLRRGATCTLCIDSQSPWPAVRHGCYRGSRLATLPIAFSHALHKKLGTWSKTVHRFIALTKFQATVMADGGLPSNRIVVKPNFLPSPPAPPPYPLRPQRVAFLGRLSVEKGVLPLIQAWRIMGKSAPPLDIIGDGPLRASLETQSQGLPITYRGQQPPAAAQTYLTNSRLLVLPSLWFEGLPMVILEALATGTPIAVSQVGALPELTHQGSCGFSFLANDPASLAAAILSAWAAPARLEKMHHACLATYKSKYTPTSNLDQLVAIYNEARAAFTNPVGPHPHLHR